MGCLVVKEAGRIEADFSAKMLQVCHPRSFYGHLKPFLVSSQQLFTVHKHQIPWQ